MATLADLLADPAVSSLDDAQAAEALNAKTIEHYRVLNTHDVRGLITLFAVRTPVERTISALANTEDPQQLLLLDACKVLVDMVRAEAAFDLNIDEYRALIGQLQTAGVFPAAFVTALYGTAREYISLAEQAGLGTVTDIDVARARDHVDRYEVRHAPN